jgi:magnesium-transporting ATPase (P-type)
MLFSASVREAAEMKPTDDGPIKAIVLTGDDVERLTVDNWNTILTEYAEIVFSRTTPEQKMLIVKETKKRGDNVVAVVSSSFLIYLFSYNLVDCRLETESTMHRL